MNINYNEMVLVSACAFGAYQFGKVRAHKVLIAVQQQMFHSYTATVEKFQILLDKSSDAGMALNNAWSKGNATSEKFTARMEEENTRLSAQCAELESALEESDEDDDDDEDESEGSDDVYAISVLPKNKVATKQEVLPMVHQDVEAKLKSVNVALELHTRLSTVRAIVQESIDKGMNLNEGQLHQINDILQITEIPIEGEL